MAAPFTATVATGTPEGIWTVESRASKPLEGPGGDRDADDGQVGAGGDGAGEVGGHAGGADYYFEAAFAGGSGVLGDALGVAVGGADLELVLDAVALRGGRCIFRGRGGRTRCRPGSLRGGSKVLQLYRFQGYVGTVVHAFEVDLLDGRVGAGARLYDGGAGADDVQDPAAGGVEAPFASSVAAW